MRIARLYVCLAIAFGAFSATPVRADEHFFGYSYDWFTPARGEKELEFWWTQENGGEADVAVEFEYGITNRWAVSPYLMLKRAHGGEFEVEGWKLEQRYALGKFGYHRFLPALYLEVKKENGEPFELEGKLIATNLFGNGWIWSTNLSFEGAVDSGAGVEYGYSTGLLHRVTDHWRLGIESFGSWSEHEHFLGPTIGYLINRDTKVLITAGLNYRGAESGAVRLFFEKEFR